MQFSRAPVLINWCSYSSRTALALAGVPFPRAAGTGARARMQPRTTTGARHWPLPHAVCLLKGGQPTTNANHTVVGRVNLGHM